MTETQWSEVAISQLQRMDVSEPRTWGPRKGSFQYSVRESKEEQFPTLPPCVAPKAPQVIKDWFL